MIFFRNIDPKDHNYFKSAVKYKIYGKVNLASFFLKNAAIMKKKFSIFCLGDQILEVAVTYKICAKAILA